jgi:hypothetical protein
MAGYTGLCEAGMVLTGQEGSRWGSNGGSRGGEVEGIDVAGQENEGVAVRVQPPGDR